MLTLREAGERKADRSFLYHVHFSVNLKLFQNESLFKIKNNKTKMKMGSDI